MNLKTIVMATDFSEASLIALETALSLASENSASLYLLHVMEFPASEDPDGSGLGAVVEKLDRDSMERLRDLIPEKGKRTLNIQTLVRHGAPAEQISALARETNADLIVVGTHGRKGLARVFLGSTAEVLLRQAPCQTLVVKPRGRLTVPAEVMV